MLDNCETLTVFLRSGRVTSTIGGVGESHRGCSGFLADERFEGVACPGSLGFRGTGRPERIPCRDTVPFGVVGRGVPEGPEVGSIRDWRIWGSGEIGDWKYGEIRDTSTVISSLQNLEISRFEDLGIHEYRDSKILESRGP